MVVYYDLSQIPRLDQSEASSRLSWVDGLQTLIPTFIFGAFPNRSIATKFTDKFTDILQHYYRDRKNQPFLSAIDLKTLSQFIFSTFADEERKFVEPDILAKRFAHEFELRMHNKLSSTEYPPQTGTARIKPLIDTFKRECGQSNYISTINAPYFSETEKISLKTKLASRWSWGFAERFTYKFNRCLTRWLLSEEISSYSDSMIKIQDELKSGSQDERLVSSFYKQKERLKEHATIKIAGDDLEYVSELILNEMINDYSKEQKNNPYVPKDCNAKDIRRILQEVFPPSIENRKVTDIRKVISSFSESLSMLATTQRLSNASLMLNSSVVKGTLP